MGRYIRFDWAIKRLLRDKANFVVLEGFLTTLLERDIKIQKMLESESNQEDEQDKQNRVDMLAEADGGELILIEVQTTTYSAYFQRMLYGTSKLITEYLQRGENYDKIRKIYSINIVYFPLGTGTDYVYKGDTRFFGIHDHSELRLTESQRQRFGAKKISDIYPEYYILKVNDFDSVAKTPLEEWITFLKTGEIAEHSTVPGLPEARRQMEVDRMSKAARSSYWRHLDNEVDLRETIRSGYDEGHFDGYREGKARGEARGEAIGEARGLEKGKAIGLEEGAKRAKMDTARRLLAMGLSQEQVAKAVEATDDEIKELL